MTKHLTLAAACTVAAIAAATLAACGKTQPDASFASLEDARGTARSNAMWNAQAYRTSNPLLKGYDILGRGDSSQTNSCPQGDGWATMDFISQDKTARVAVRCSTVSANLGCLEDADFKTKSYAAEDNHCQPPSKVPYHLPKIGQ